LKPGFEVFPDALVKYFPFPTFFPNSPSKMHSLFSQLSLPPVLTVFLQYTQLLFQKVLQF
jgi:hypothetical protein